MSRYGALKLGAKTSAYLLTATGLAALASDPSNSAETLDLPSNFLNAVVRSSRAVFSITSCVVDYKYSLHGVPAGSEEYGAALSEIHLRSAGRILKMCDANKGFYIKAGQFVAAMRQVPREYSSTLSSLQDQAVPCDFEAVKEVVVKSLGKDLSEIFHSFDEQPIAAASIAQVHHAYLQDHQEVAVKVQYPGLEYQMNFDLTTMAFLSRFVAWLFPEYRFQWLVTEFTKSIASELDFIQEAKNSERAAYNFRKNSRVRIPRVYWDFTSRQVLTMQFCKGQKIDDVEYLNRMGINPLKVAKTLIDVFAEMIFVHGFLHGDPHPGNILVSPHGPDGYSLVILDHGIYKPLSEDFRKNYCLLWEALISLDSQKIQQLGETFGVGKYAKFFPVIFTGRTMNSKSALGKGMSDEEKKYLKEEVKSLMSKLGASQRVRLLSYAKCALSGLSTEASAESGSAVLVLSRFKTRIKYIQLRLLLEIMEFVAYMDDVSRSLITKLRRLILSAKDRIWSLHHLLVSATRSASAPTKKFAGQRVQVENLTGLRVQVENLTGLCLEQNSRTGLTIVMWSLRLPVKLLQLAPWAPSRGFFRLLAWVGLPGLATIALAGAAVGIRNVFSSLILTIAPCDAAEPWKDGSQDAALLTMQETKAYNTNNHSLAGSKWEKMHEWEGQQRET
ncbi:Protein kinase superfamily protein [Striga hermonthica]|uniref:Protein kinase superfamily protein n=1 Tax=Striga hermonthica TaxID=68872 RepID=A0A9N7R4F5_STRHE|nr:Protein kinase superfamily protein [Striga hermonthica]